MSPNSISTAASAPPTSHTVLVMVSYRMRRTDFIHLCLMLIALGLAYVVPFELLALAYVVLGPAHYTTEISWLHERRYFVPHRGYAVALVAIALGAALIANASWFGFTMWAALVLGALLVTPRAGAQGVVLVIAASGLTAIFYMRSPALAVIGVLLPTLIHVSVFTLIFMALGAWRSRSAPQAGLIAIYLAGIALILLVPPTGATVIPGFATIARDYFGTVAQALGVLFGVPDIHLDMRLTGLLAFLYTYHYLNWFIKAEVIRWADIPRRRWLVIGAVSAASTGLYFYDYALGFSVLLALSLAHVVLEFPLNALAVRQLGEAAANGFKTLITRPHGARARVAASSGSARWHERRSRAGPGAAAALNALLAGLAILIIGESHMAMPDYLITTLHDDLAAQGAVVHSYGMCGASAGDWVYPATISCGRAERHEGNGPQIERSESPAWKIDDLVAKHHPGLIVVEMGDTMAGYGQETMPRAWIYEQVRTLTGRFAAQNIPCAWVGPPWGSEGSSYPKTLARVKEMSEFLTTAVAPCHFIDSTQFSKQGEWPTIDGKHLTGNGYRAWGADITTALDRLARRLKREP